MFCHTAGDTAAGTSKDWCHQFDLTKSMEDCGTRTAHLVSHLASSLSQPAVLQSSAPSLELQVPRIFQAESWIEPVNHALTCIMLPTLQIHMQECRQYTGPQALDRLVADVQHMVDHSGRTSP